jgi:spermidine synthase
VSRPRISPATTLLTLVFLSGFTSLAYELVFYKLCGYVFGTSNLAVTTVLVAFMGGLAIGSRTFGIVADRVRRPIVLYGLLELFIGAYVLLVPFLMRVATAAYVAIGISADIRNPDHAAVRFLISVLILLPPTAAMGGTLPVLVKALVRDHAMAETKVARLYGANTLGAALGTLVTNYLLLRFLGIVYLLLVGSLVNLFIFLRARRLDKELGNFADASQIEASNPRAADISFGLAVGAVFVTGVLSFACELVWTHLLATIVGLSVYAFGLMLFTFLLGIALGSLLIVPSLEHSRADHRVVLAWLQLGAGAYMLGTIPLWDKLSFVFSAAGAALAPGFALREVIRAAVCMIMLLPPCLAIGATFPILIRSAAATTDANLRRLGRGVGTLYAVNTFGCILGAIATGFLLLQAFGSRRVLFAAGLAYVLFGIAFAGRKRPAFLIFVPAAALALVLFPPWDSRSPVSGRSIYFAEEAKIQDLVFLAEDPEGGFTSVTREPEGLVFAPTASTRETTALIWTPNTVSRFCRSSSHPSLATFCTLGSAPARRRAPSHAFPSPLSRSRSFRLALSRRIGTSRSSTSESCVIRAFAFT